MNCQCADSKCPTHMRMSQCSHAASITVYRVDMQDAQGIPMCGECGGDALESGLFRLKDDDDSHGNDFDEDPCFS